MRDLFLFTLFSSVFALLSSNSPTSTSSRHLFSYFCLYCISYACNISCYLSLYIYLLRSVNAAFFLRTLTPWGRHSPSSPLSNLFFATHFFLSFLFFIPSYNLSLFFIFLVFSVLFVYSFLDFARGVSPSLKKQTPPKAGKKQQKSLFIKTYLTK